MGDGIRKEENNIVINKALYIIHFPDNIKTDFMTSKNGWWRKKNENDWYETA